jgi:hypothetical protein
MQRIQQYKNFVDENHKNPLQNSKNSIEKSVGMWKSNVRKYYKKNTLSQERIDILNELLPDLLK